MGDNQSVQYILWNRNFYDCNTASYIYGLSPKCEVPVHVPISVLLLKYMSAGSLEVSTV